MAAIYREGDRWTALSWTAKTLTKPFNNCMQVYNNTDLYGYVIGSTNNNNNNKTQ